MPLCDFFRGPNLDDEEDETSGTSGAGEGDTGGVGTRDKKEKTPQQRAGEAMAKYIVEKSNGASYSFK